MKQVARVSTSREVKATYSADGLLKYVWQINGIESRLPNNCVAFGLGLALSWVVESIRVIRAIAR